MISFLEISNAKQDEKQIMLCDVIEHDIQGIYEM